MSSIIKPAEMDGKLVGGKSKGSAFEYHDRMVRQFHALGRKLPYPKGVYRFRTFEEADAWALKYEIAAIRNPVTRSWHRVKAWWRG